MRKRVFNDMRSKSVKSLFSRSFTNLFRDMLGEEEDSSSDNEDGGDDGNDEEEHQLPIRRREKRVRSPLPTPLDPHTGQSYKRQMKMMSGKGKESSETREPTPEYPKSPFPTHIDDDILNMLAEATTG
ncbi:hypothetical protein L1987_09619 [Smallanthus sonchifolius]|uniref:Uncharacterized protein n=1 Tax=Smallanthus sonchifolius TaxID=185202 RepID=A0ACB9JPW1_9ASTR|nr:hypothetical protein L1987_09619 [Smallanthus sonchifolius]